MRTERFLITYIQGVAFVTQLLPLVVISSWQSAYIFPQTTGARFIALLIIMPMALLWIWYPQHRPRRSLVMGSAALWFLAMVGSNAFSIRPYWSFIGYWQRYGSVIDWAALWVLFLLYISVLTDIKSRERFASVVAMVGTIIALLGVGQRIGLPIIFFFESDRIFSTLGNPGFLASYLLLVLGFTLWILHRTRTKNFKIFLFVCVALQIIGLILSGTRSALLGLGIGTMVAVALIIWRNKKYTFSRHSITKLVGYGGIALLSIGAVLIVLSQGSVSTSRILTLSASDQTTQSRLQVWRHAVQGFYERPVLGWGENNFIIPYYMYFAPYEYEGIENTGSFDRSHNEYFDRFVSGGILQGIAYVIFWLSLIRTLFRCSAKEPASVWLASCSVAYGIYLLFFFHSIADSLLMVGVAAYAHLDAEIRGTRQAVPVRTSPRDVSWWILIWGITMSALVAVCVVIRPILAQYYIGQAKYSHNTLEVRQYLKTAWSLSRQAQPGIITYVIDRYPAQNTSDGTLMRLQLRLWLEEYLRREPYDFSALMMYIDVLRVTSESNPFQLQFAYDLTSAALRLSPHHPLIYNRQGVLLLDRSYAIGDPELKIWFRQRAREKFGQAIKWSRRDTESFILYLASAQSEENSTEALLEYVQSAGERLTVREWSLLIDVMFNQSTPDQMREFYKITREKMNQTYQKQGLIEYLDMLVNLKASM